MNIQHKHFTKVNQALNKLRFNPSERNARLRKISRNYPYLDGFTTIEAVLDNGATDLECITKL